jgi:ElaB/YqjD/DUF883 family membrane-anchored ribosome-binding protein
MRHKTGNGHNVDLQQFLDDIKTVVHDGEELLKTGVSEVKQRAMAGAKSTDKIVRSRPYQSLGVIFGLGLVAGLLVAGVFGGDAEADDE